jgi:hypothetical protein
VSDSPHDRVILGGGSLHESFQREVQKLLETVDLSEEDRQKILTGMVCPCCGGGASMVVKLKEKD